MSYNANNLQYIKNVDGFDIYYNDTDRYEYVIFHPSFEKDYVEAFQTISEAENFCLSENIKNWKEVLFQTVG